MSFSIALCSPTLDCIITLIIATLPEALSRREMEQGTTSLGDLGSRLFGACQSGRDSNSVDGTQSTESRQTFGSLFLTDQRHYFFHCSTTDKTFPFLEMCVLFQ